MSENDLVLQLKGLKKEFQSGKQRISVLSDVSLDVKAGDSVSIQGQSGSGKTTLLNCIAAIEVADDGVVFWDGKDIGGLSESDQIRLRGEKLGFVFQSFHLIPELNVFENVLLPARVLQKSFGPAKERVEDLLKRLGLWDRKSAAIKELSGGERQRIALARALVNRPRLILADEPTGNLDEHTSEAVMNELMTLVKEEGAALLLVTHSRHYAMQLERSYLLKDGVLAFGG